MTTCEPTHVMRPPPSSSGPTAPDLQRGTPRRVQVVRCTCPPATTRQLADWLAAVHGNERWDVEVLTATQLPALGVGVAHEVEDLLILDEPNGSTVQWLLSTRRAIEDAEIILINSSLSASARLRGQGLPIAFDLRAPIDITRLGQACVGALAVHRPMRRLCRQAVGTLPLRDALSLVRMQMVQEALKTTRSKSGAARQLGVTRPAIQHVLRGLTLAGSY